MHVLLLKTDLCKWDLAIQHSRTIREFAEITNTCNQRHQEDTILDFNITTSKKWQKEHKRIIINKKTKIGP